MSPGGGLSSLIFSTNLAEWGISLAVVVFQWMPSSSSGFPSLHTLGGGVMRASSGFGRMLVLVGSLAGALMLSISSPVVAQSYDQQNLVSDLPGLAPTMDP